jgi:hypothetical protein
MRALPQSIADFTEEAGLPGPQRGGRRAARQLIDGANRRPRSTRGNHRGPPTGRRPDLRVIGRNAVAAVSAGAWPTCGALYYWSTHRGFELANQITYVSGFVCTVALVFMRHRASARPAYDGGAWVENLQFLVDEVRATRAGTDQNARQIAAFDRALSSALEYAGLEDPAPDEPPALSRWKRARFRGAPAHLRAVRDVTGPQPRILCTAPACGLSA